MYSLYCNCILTCSSSNVDWVNTQETWADSLRIVVHDAITSFVYSTSLDLEEILSCMLMYFLQSQNILPHKIYLISSKSWSATGFYANVKLKKHDKLFNVHCIMTNYHVFLEMKKRGDGMVAVFHHESTEKESNEFALEPFVLFAHSKVCIPQAF